MDDTSVVSHTNFPATNYPRVGIDPEHEIRIVELRPGKRGDRVRCSLVPQRLAHTSDGKIAPLDYPPPKDRQETRASPRPATAYDALSYCWGSFDSHGAIQLNEVDDFPVSANLHAALRRLRKGRGPPVRIWIDQICINQHDIIERNRQVSVMANIFNQAECVFIWLGDTARNTRPTLFRRWHLQYQFNEALKQRPQWWTRAWVVPEFLAARAEPMAVFGPCLMPWTELCDSEDSFWGAVTLIYLTLQTGKWSGVRRMSSLRRLKEHHIQSMGKLDLASFGSVLLQTDCSDPRDKVYSILGFVDNLKRMLRPDYVNSVWHVFSEATCVETMTTANLKVLSLVYLPRNDRDQELPTWAVDFAYRLLPKFDSDDPYGFGNPDFGYAALFALEVRPWTKKAPQTVASAMSEQGAIAAGTYETKGPRILRYMGLAFDTIHFVVNLRHVYADRTQTSVSRTRGTFRDSAYTRRLRREARRNFRYHDRTLLTPLEIGFCDNVVKALNGSNPFETLRHVTSEKPSLHDYLRSLLDDSDGSFDSLRMPVAIALFEAWHQNIENLTSPEFSWLYSRAKLMMHRMEIWDEYFVFSSLGRALIVTNAGFIGLAPLTVQEGDRVILPYGSRMPMLVRPSGEYVTFQGFAYVNGIMDDELYEKCPDIQLREEEIRMI